jgi:Zn-dependent protease with chaperone function
MNGFAAIGLGAVHVWLASLSQAAAGSLVAAIWQGVLLAAAAGLGLRLLPKTPASVRFAIWFAVFAVVTALPVVSLWPRAAGVTQLGPHAWLTLDDRWSLAIVMVWLAASLVRAGTLAVAALRVRSLWRRANPVEIDLAAQTAGLRRAQVCTSVEVDRPTVIGFFSPRILIPEWLLNKLTAAELEQIVLHEAGHLGRADDWMNLLQKIALVVFPLNPALAWVERRLCFERELACDERVLGATGAPKAYAACLATLAEYRLGRRGFALALGALGRESELGRRVGRILQRCERMKPLHARLVLGGAMLGLLVGAAGLERCPQIVGFARAETIEATASGAQPQAVRNSMPATSKASMLQVSAIHRTRVNNDLRGIANGAHESLLVTSEPASSIESNHDSRKPAEKHSGQSVRMVQTAATGSVSQRRIRSVSDVDPSQPAAGVTQWVVVTSWAGEGEAQVVMTTARTTNRAERAASSQKDQQSGDQSGPSEEVPSYAAVPVRGGWLIFQL